MANIELVIKIPEEDFERCKKRFQMRVNIMGDAIANGTPLPKGHGRIVDIDKVLEEMKATRTYDIPFAVERVKPIIEADKEDKECKTYCTECPYFNDIIYEGEQWYGARCKKDGHSTKPSMYAIKSLNDDCPLTKDKEDK